MYIVRAVPKKIPPNRNYVVDSFDKIEMDNYDMRWLADMDDSVILLEWDIAVAYHDMWNFKAHCASAPNLVHVAPYPLYSDSLEDLHAPVWAHRTMINPMPLQLEWIDYGEPVCDIFSTGMVYLPQEICHRVAESDDLITWHNNITDSKLAFWYYYNVGQKVPVHWDVRPIHLHYNQEDFYDGFIGHRLGTDRRVASTGWKTL